MITQQGIQDTMAEMGKLDATNCSSEEAIARYIVSELDGYRKGSQHYATDVEFISQAIQAYAKLLQDNGVKVA